MLKATVNCLLEWSYQSGHDYKNPFLDVDLDVVVTDPAGHEQIFPAFWAGDRTWSIRYASAMPGEHRYRTVCSNASDASLHGREGVLMAEPYSGPNQLLQHGPLRVAADRRHLEHRDGTPFFWLADTWWMSLCKRLEWPGEFKSLTADRVAKGFSVIHVIAGLYPDMPQFDPRGANEAGYPWDKDFTTINPAYFDMADLRIDWLVRQGLVPCIVGCWGYFLELMGEAAMKQHWRYLIARYSAYPVVWCAAGEAKMAFYLKELPTPADVQAYRDAMEAGWTEQARHIRAIDPGHHPLTVHPNGGESSRQMVPADVLDFDWLQTGHGDRDSAPYTIRIVNAAYAAQPPLPVINSEVCYEGIGEACREEVQRYNFWACMLSGACGHSYGANGLWQLNRREQPFGPSPHGMSWGDLPWDDAAQLPGSQHLGLGKQFLERYEWWRFEPHPEWVDPHATPESPLQSFAAGIARELRLVYVPTMWSLPTFSGFESDVRYRAFLFDPRTGMETDLGSVEPDERGNWRLPVRQPAFQDWVVVFERVV